MDLFETRGVSTLLRHPVWDADSLGPCFRVLRSCGSGLFAQGFAALVLLFRVQ